MFYFLSGESAPCIGGDRLVCTRDPNRPQQQSRLRMVSEWITRTAATVEEGCSRDVGLPAVRESTPLVIGLPLSRIVWWLSCTSLPTLKEFTHRRPPVRDYSICTLQSKPCGVQRVAMGAGQRSLEAPSYKLAYRRWVEFGVTQRCQWVGESNPGPLA